MRESPPTSLELGQALRDLFYAANQCATYHFWYLWARPTIQGIAELNDLKLSQFLDNGIVEATLLFIRKSVEFFRVQGVSDKPDTIYSYRYSGFVDQGWVVPETTYLELHKRVGHVTVREVRYGHVEWDIFSMAVDCLNKWIGFFDFLASDSSSLDQADRKECRVYSTALTSVVNRMERDASKSKDA